jgi:hypothetical protein
LIRVTSIGFIGEPFLAEIRSIAVDFYSKAGGEPPLLEIYIYSSGERMRARILREAEELGVTVMGDFVVLHEAWRGWPRIHVNYEECANMDTRVTRALLLHELAHSKLHGSPYYYLVSLDKSIAGRYGREALIIEYMASIAVKDLEALELLRNLGYEEEIASYVEFVKTQISDIKCYEITGLLELAKLATPFIVKGQSVDNLDPSCAGIAGRVVEIVERLRRVEGDLEDRIRFLVNELEKVLSVEGSPT